MVSQYPEQPVVAGVAGAAHGYPRPARGIVCRVATTRPFVITTHESRGHIGGGRLYPVTGKRQTFTFSIKPSAKNSSMFKLFPFIKLLDMLP